MQAINRFLRVFIPLFVAGFIGTMPHLAIAQGKGRPAPEINSFQVTLSDQLAPGSEVDITLEGTPRGKATVRLSGVNRTIVLNEVDPGIYEGSYTLSRRDRLTAQPTARATLQVRKFSTVATQALVTSPPPVASRPAPVTSPPPVPAPVTLALERFTVVPVARIEPGAELRFAALGTPGARASFSIDGVVRDVAMTEVRSGRYEGAYTIRRNDNFLPSLNIVATLEGGGQTVRSRLNQALLVDAKPPMIRNFAPANNEAVANNPVSVSATFDDSGGVGVDPKSVKILIGGQDVTRNASVTPQFFTWRGDLLPGAHQVDVTAMDIAGNAMRQTWMFRVAGAQAPAPAAVLPLQITSHANNAQVGNGPIEVRGRTAPDANLQVQVQAIASIAGLFGINQQVYSQNLRADPSGNFSFTFQSLVPVPGTRYETSITASKGELVRESKLVLFQQR